MRVAVIHEWLAGSGYTGSERVVEQILEIYPDAHLYATVDFFEGDDRDFLKGREVKTSFIQHLPFARRLYKQYLPFAPLAVEQYDLSEYDLVISSSHAVAKGVITGPDQLHISYVHSPIRYAWDLQHQYLKEAGLDKGLRGWMTKRLLHRIRMWDVRTANGVDHFVANSRFIARRIKKVYGRSSTVIYPPVDVEAFPLSEDKDDYYLTASRLVPYKRIDAVVEAFSQLPDRKLVVIGDGPEMSKIQRLASPNVEVLGHQPFDVLKKYMQQARAFIFAGIEDFGIMPVEAQACGTPVIAYSKGGLRETVIGLDQSHPTGLFFDDQSPAAIRQAVLDFEENEQRFSPQAARDNASRFGVTRFRLEFKDFVETQYSVFQSSL